MVIALIAMTIFLVLQDKVTWLSYLTIIAMVVFVVGFAIGLGKLNSSCLIFGILGFILEAGEISF